MDETTPNAPANQHIKLYPYQERDISRIFAAMNRRGGKSRILYQLPTGGGKTVIFSEITRRYIEHFGGKVVVLTHRIELCGQTSATLKRVGIRNKIVDSNTKSAVIVKRNYPCYVAMVETLKNRIRDKQFDTSGVGLVIIDEAHHNSFRKLLGKFNNASVIGVTATPLSFDNGLPLNRSYDELVTGETIGSLIGQGFLARPKTWRYDVELNTLKTGVNGDYTVRTSDELYASPAMLGLLLHAFETHARGKKTLIFNNGVFASRAVCTLLQEHGYPVKHLDHRTPPDERRSILEWFKRTKGAVLTSVSILTAGFDEPTVQCILLYRATNSLTLFHQMIGRGARTLPRKKTFTIIDLGNNTDRFGAWEAPVDWPFIFDHPEAYYEQFSHQAGEQPAHALPSDMRAQFPNTLELSFDVQQAYHDATASGEKPRTVIRDSIRQHALMCIENSTAVEDALELASSLDKEIAWRVKQYCKCHGNVTKNYTEWLLADYKERLQKMVRKLMSRKQAS